MHDRGKHDAEPEVIDCIDDDAFSEKEQKEGEQEIVEWIHFLDDVDLYSGEKKRMKGVLLNQLRFSVERAKVKWWKRNRLDQGNAVEKCAEGHRHLQCGAAKLLACGAGSKGICSNQCL